MDKLSPFPYITEEDKKNIKVLMTMPEWASFMKVLDMFIDDMRDVTHINYQNALIAEQAFGRTFAVQTVKDLMATLGVYDAPVKKKHSGE